MKYLSRLKHKGIEITVVITALLIIYGCSYLWRARSALGEGKRLYEAGNYSAAVVPLRRYSALAPWDGEGHYWVGNALGFSNRLDEAVVELRRATELEPKDAGYAIALGNALHHLSRYAEAEKAFRKGLELGSKEADVHVSLGMTLDKQNRHVEAVREYREAHKIQPDNRRARKALIGLDVKSGERK